MEEQQEQTQPSPPVKAPFNIDDPLARIPHESIKANQALRDYAHLGMTRSLSNLIKMYSKRLPDAGGEGSIPPTTHIATVKRWSARHRWVERSQAYDITLMLEEEAKWTKRYLSMREKEFRIAETLLTRVEEMAKFPVAELSREEDGKITIIKPAKWDWQSAGRLMESVAKLTRLAAGKTLGLYDLNLDTMSDAQLIARIQQAQSELGFSAPVAGGSEEKKTEDPNR